MYYKVELAVPPELGRKDIFPDLFTRMLVSEHYNFRDYRLMMAPWDQLSDQQHQQLIERGFGPWYSPVALVESPGNSVANRIVRVTEKELELVNFYKGIPGLLIPTIIELKDKNREPHPIAAFTFEASATPILVPATPFSASQKSLYLKATTTSRLIFAARQKALQS